MKKPNRKTPPLLHWLHTRRDGWPDKEHHTLAEQIVIYQIRKKVALYSVKLIVAAQRAGKLPTPREFLARMLVNTTHRIFAAKAGRRE